MLPATTRKPELDVELGIQRHDPRQWATKHALIVLRAAFSPSDASQEGSPAKSRAGQLALVRPDERPSYAGYSAWPETRCMGTRTASAAHRPTSRARRISILFRSEIASRLSFKARVKSSKRKRPIVNAPKAPTSTCRRIRSEHLRLGTGAVIEMSVGTRCLGLAIDHPIGDEHFVGGHDGMIQRQREHERDVATSYVTQRRRRRNHLAPHQSVDRHLPPSEHRSAADHGIATREVTRWHQPLDRVAVPVDDVRSDSTCDGVRSLGQQTHARGQEGRSAKVIVGGPHEERASSLARAGTRSSPTHPGWCSDGRS